MNPMRMRPRDATMSRRVFLKSIHEGIQSPLYCAVAPEAAKLSGRYLRYAAACLIAQKCWPLQGVAASPKIV